jgi:hypothetical protein
MEQIENGKSANQIWKESGTTLSFADWIQREKDKGRFLPNQIVSEVTDSIKNSLGDLKNSLGIDAKSKVIDTNTKVVGLSKWVIVASLAIIGGAVAYTVIKKKK